MEQEEKYNLVIVGGGPSAVKFMFNLLRTSKLPEYIGSIAIIEKNKTFGSGNYESKMTYANYGANEYLKMMYYYQSKQILSICNDILETNAYKTLQQYGEKQPPKALVGYFMRLMGNVLLKLIYQLKKELIFKPNREVIGIRLLTDGWFQIRTANSEAPIKEKYKTIRARNVLLCTGREQLQGDIFCQEAGLISMLKNSPSGISGSGQKAFESAELLLNGPVMYLSQEPFTQFSQRFYTCPHCKQLRCSCFGSLVPIKYQWHTTDVVLPEYGPQQLKIQIQTVPRVYFPQQQNEYLTIPDTQVGKKGGEANYLTGLRGRARTLLLKVLSGQEKRLKLTKDECQTQIDARESLCKEVEVKDSEGVLIQFHKAQGLYQLDLKGRLKCAKGSIRNLYAYGSNSIAVDQQEKACQEENGDCSLGFEDCNLMYIKVKPDDVQQWYDTNEFPLTAQSQEKVNEFDSDLSVLSEIIETETFALNQLQELYCSGKRKKK